MKLHELVIKAFEENKIIHAKGERGLKIKVTATKTTVEGSRSEFLGIQYGYLWAKENFEIISEEPFPIPEIKTFS